MGSFAVGLLVVLGVVVALALITLVMARIALGRHNRVVVGVRSPTPLSWLSSPRPEAILHRRLRAAGRRLDVLPAADGLTEVVGRLRTELVELDAHLVTVVRRPGPVRRADRREIAQQVTTIEDLVRRAEDRLRTPSGSLDDLADRLTALEAADDELRGLDPG